MKEEQVITAGEVVISPLSLRYRWRDWCLLGMVVCLVSILALSWRETANREVSEKRITESHLRAIDQLEKDLETSRAAHARIIAELDVIRRAVEKK